MFRDPSPERLAGIAGVLFVVLYAAAAVLWGGVRPDEPATTVAHDLQSHRGAAVVSSYVLLAAGVMLLAFAAATTRTEDATRPFSKVLSATGFGAGAISAGLLATANAVLGALAGYLLTGSPPETVRALAGLWDAFTTASGLFLGVFAVVVSVLAFDSRNRARWIRWFGLVAGAILIVGAGSLATPFHGVGPFWVLGLLGTLAWILITGISGLLRPNPRGR